MKARLSGTYLFRTKDPIVDYLRGPASAVKNKAKLAREANVAASTVHNMFDGKTRCPKFYTAVSIARALGPEGEAALIKCIQEGGRTVVAKSKTKLKVIEGGRRKVA